MHRLYNHAKLVHADLNEYNILWHEGHCWLIDVAQAVEPQHPNALQFLMNDCKNIVNVIRHHFFQYVLTFYSLISSCSLIFIVIENSSFLVSCSFLDVRYRQLCKARKNFSNLLPVLMWTICLLPCWNVCIRRVSM